MLQSLQAIKNPVSRTIAGATALFSIVTLLAAIALGITSPKENQSNYKLGVYSSLLALVAGGIAGGVTCYKPTEKSASKSKTSSTNIDTEGWKDWRDFIVDRKVQESKEITSFYLKPKDGGKLSGFKPGQFLTIKLDIPQQPRPVIRTYSLSDYNNSADYYRLSIKRECAPKDWDVPPGVVSNFMHDSIEPGSVISAKPPNGKFFIDTSQSLPAVLISNGVGITPMIAMAKACVGSNSKRNLWFLHGARNGDHHVFREEINALAANNSTLNVHYKYSRPQTEDQGNFHSQGYVDKELLETEIMPQIRAISGGTDAEYFLCGSPNFMDSIRSGLEELGVGEDRIFFESFTKDGQTKGKSEPSKTSNGSIDSAEIVFAQSGKTLTWKKGDGTVLEFAEQNGIDPDYSCRQGICLTCMSQIQEGEVEYLEPPTNEPDEGSVLICICQPKSSKVVLNI